MARKAICDIHGSYDAQLPGCPECAAEGQAAADDRTRVIGWSRGEKGDLRPAPGHTAAADAEIDGDATLIAGRRRAATGATPASTPPNAQGDRWAARPSARASVQPGPPADLEPTVVVGPTREDAGAWRGPGAGSAGRREDDLGPTASAGSAAGAAAGSHRASPGADDDVEATIIPGRRRGPAGSGDARPGPAAAGAPERPSERDLLGWLIVKNGERRGQVSRVSRGIVLGPNGAGIMAGALPLAEIMIQNGQFVIRRREDAYATANAGPGLAPGVALEINGAAIGIERVLRQDDEIRVGDWVYVLKVLPPEQD